MNYHSIVQIFFLILPSFIVIALGSFLKMVNVAKDSWVDILNKYGLWIGFPSLIFETLIRLDRSRVVSKLDIFYVNILFLLFLILIALSITKIFDLRRKLANTFIICIFFGNVAYLGYPVVMSIFPNREAELSIIISIYVLVLFTIGIGWLEFSRDSKINIIKLMWNFLKNPFIIAITLGIVFLILGIRLPSYIEKAFVMLKASASPVVLFALGIFIYRKISLKKIFIPVLFLTAIKLILVPSIFLTGAVIFKNVNKFSVSIIESAMPLAITPFALASMYDLEKETIGTAIVFSTVVSMLTLPIFIFLIRS